MSAQIAPDACLSRVRAHDELELQPLLQGLLRLSGVTRRTPQERIHAAVAEELVDLLTRTVERLAALPHGGLSDVARALLQEVERQLAAGLADPSAPAFPREALRAAVDAARAAGEAGVAAILEESCQRHERLEQRVGWLLSGTSPETLETLDPKADCDRIYHAVTSAFRVESRVVELLTINRIAQSAAASLFIRSTRESELYAVRRFFDTFTLFAHYFEWGEDSLKGRTALGRINAMHGRYTLANEGMKYILLDGIFTWIEAIRRIGHRPMTRVEQLGWFHAHIRLGRGMHVQELSDDWDAMSAWFEDFNRRNAAFHTLKRETFELFVNNSLGDATFPGLGEALLLGARVGMDDTFRSALGYEAPSEEEVRAVQSVFFTLGSLHEKLPPTAWLRSLQNNPARPTGASAAELGVHVRSEHLPVIDGSRPNGGHPEHQPPLRSASEALPVELPVISLEEVARHASAESLWVVIHGEVYDLTGWARLHPGGLDTLLSVAGRDATQDWLASEHSGMADIYRLNFRIGRVG